MNKFNQLISIALLLLSSYSVQALPFISGTLDMQGGASVLSDYVFDSFGEISGTVTTDASLAVAIDFNPNAFRVVAASDDLSSTLGMIGGIKDFAFDPFNGPMADFWTVGGFLFELTDVTRGTSNEPATFLVLNGRGIIRDANLVFADTVATWNYSSDTTGNGAFSWSAVSAVSVPEPAVLALISVGLIGLGLRKKV